MGFFNPSVLLLATVFLTAFSIFVVGTAWFDALQLLPSTTDVLNKIALFLHPINYTVLAGISALGCFFIVSKSPQPNRIENFYKALLGHLFFDLATGIFVLAVIFQQRSAAATTADCSSPIVRMTQPECQQQQRMFGAGKLVVVYVLTWFLEGYIIASARAYTRQLLSDANGTSRSAPKLPPVYSFAQPLTAQLSSKEAASSRMA